MATRTYRKKSSVRATIAAPLARSMPTPRKITPPVRSFAEPVEPDHIDRANQALDRIEAEARVVIAAGGTAALRQRLARLLLDR